MNYSNLLKKIPLKEYDSFLNSNLSTNFSDFWINVTDNALSFLISVLSERTKKSLFVLTPYPEQSLFLHQHLTKWLDDSIKVLRFPEINISPFDVSKTDVLSSLNRAGILANIKNKNQKSIILSSTLAASEKTMNLELSESNDHLKLKKEQILSLSDFTKKLVKLGYDIFPYVLEPGNIAIRGSIVDVFPSNLKNPIRVEFFDNQIESIRNFDVNTQISIEIIKEAFIFSRFEAPPALIDEKLLDKKLSKCDFSNCDMSTLEHYQSDFAKIISGQLSYKEYFKYGGFFNDNSIFDYIDSDYLLILLRPSEIENACKQVFSRFLEIKSRKEKEGEIPLKYPDNRLSWNEIEEKLKKHKRKVVISPRFPTNKKDRIFEKINSKVIPINYDVNLNDPLNSVREKISSEMNSSVILLIVTLNYARVLEALKGMEYQIDEEKSQSKNIPSFEQGSITLKEDYLREGFEIRISKEKTLKVLTDYELFGVKRKTTIIEEKRNKKKLDFNLLMPDSYVVHQKHGIGKFLKITKVKNQGDREFLEIEYASQDRIFLPVDEIYQIEKYLGPSHPQPKLTRLGGNHWKKAKLSAKHSTEELASDLLSLQSSRMKVKGLKCDKDTVWQNALESSFPFIETEDQVKTLEEIKKDLEKNVPMDRVLCGDVGFGKTEIAVRASFKVIQSGRQVAILVPTTVLAEQHFHTFTERLKPFPVKVSSLSRFLKGSEETKVLKGLSSGSLDLCIGTHRLLQRDVSFNNLGLIIIDEEHRFGVKAKEQLKKLRVQVDILSMTATPIPRTLNLALSGIRDLSSLQIPPDERVPVETFVMDEEDLVIREAILRERDRNGQVFVVHNRIHDIQNIENRLSKLIPEVEIRFAHGRMSEENLREIMNDFTQEKFEVLVCTTIIESGIDLPNVNTLIVFKADQFGLAQLYQLRGRVGRSEKQAYAYFLLSPGSKLTLKAEQRLEAIMSATELGSGVELAMRDMEIRGAGNVLGAEQSGFISLVGMNMYSKLLNQSVKKLKFGEEFYSDEDQNILIDLDINSDIPNTYIPDLSARLSLYQTILGKNSIEDLEIIEEEILDRFGVLPDPVKILIEKSKMRLYCKEIDIISVKKNGDFFSLRFNYSISSIKNIIRDLLDQEVHIGYSHIKIENKLSDLKFVKNMNEILKKLLDLKSRLIKAF